MEKGNFVFSPEYFWNQSQSSSFIIKLLKYHSLNQNLHQIIVQISNNM